MSIGSTSALRRPWGLLALIAVLGLTVALATDTAVGASGHGKRAVVAKKKCKKKHRSASSAKKKCKKKKPAPVVVPPPPTPAPLTASEVQNRIIEAAGEYCAEDVDCTGDYGYYYDTAPGDPYCTSKSTYSWTCQGWYDYDDGDLVECAFSEVVERDGLSGIKSHHDDGYNEPPFTDGWYCFLLI
jgi:hypothetical protein